MDIGRGRDTIFPSVGGLTPLLSMIFMMRLQKGRLVRAADLAATFPII